MSRYFALALRLAVLTLCLASATVQAGKIAIVLGGDDAIVAMLKTHSDTFGNAYLRMIQEEHLTPSVRSLNAIRAAMHTSVIARMEYTYEKGGRMFKRVYYGRSGPAMKVVYDRATFSTTPSVGASASSTGGETSGSDSGSRPYIAKPEDIARDAEERIYYPRDPTFVRAPNLSSDDLTVKATEVKTADGRIVSHAADAELKIFRKIEADIKTGDVTRGGKLVGYVSKTLCASCERASAAFAREYDVDGKIYQLVEPGKNISQVNDELLARSNASSTKLKEMRKAFAERHFSATGATAPIEDYGKDVERLTLSEVEESAGIRAGATCGE